MDQLEIAIKSLSPKERTLLIERIKTQKKKLELFHLLSKSHRVGASSRETVALNKKSGYQRSNLNKLYTLRNRLHNDITDVKMSLIHNRLIKTREVVPSLRNLIYAKDTVTVMRELKRQEKNAMELELFDELSEIQFCFFLLYRQDPGKSAFYLEAKSGFEEKHKLHLQLEELYYSKLFDTQDLIYRFNEGIFTDSLKHLKSARELNGKLGSLSSEFLYLSGKLALYLNSEQTITDTAQVGKDLKRLNDIYHTSFLIYKYPNCGMAIKSLFSRFYYLTGQYGLFESTAKEMQRQIAEYKNYPMFSCLYFYYVYTLLCYTARHDGRSHDWLKQVNVDCENMFSENLSDQSRVYFLYLWAIMSVLENKPKKAIGELEEARLYFNRLSVIGRWIIEEIIMLQVLLQVAIRDFDIVEQQLKNYKRRKAHKDGKSQSMKIDKGDINMLQKAVAGYEKEGDLDSLVSSFQWISSKYSLLKTIRIRQVLK